jgi:hypothetical protein
VTFLLDNMISPKVALALRALEQDAWALREKFAENTPDSQWIAQLGRYGWALVTFDRRILSRPHEAAILKQGQVTAFFLGPFFRKYTFWDQAVWIIRHWPKFVNMAQTISRGTCFRVQQNAKMTPIGI